MPAVVISKESQRAVSYFLHCSRGHPKVVQQPSVRLPSPDVRRGTRRQAQQDRERG
jgi:hypothetical protein